MARPLRIEYPGAWYHILNRGRRKEKVFFAEPDYRSFMHLLGECSRLFNLEVHSYSLMPNHYHLLIHTPEGNLSRIMRHLDGVYTQKINRRYKLEGSLFKGRFKSILVEEKSYLLELVRYIHRNPLKVYSKSKLHEHEWTSYWAYINNENKPPWLHTAKVLSYFSKYEKEAKKGLHSFTIEKPSHKLQLRLDSLNWPVVLGGKEFADKIKEGVLGKKIKNVKEIPQYKESLRKISTNEALELMLKEFNLERNKFLDKYKKGNMDYKRGFIYVCREHLFGTNASIKNILGGLSQSSISKQYRIACNQVKLKQGCYNSVVKLEKVIKC